MNECCFSPVKSSAVDVFSLSLSAAPSVCVRAGPLLQALCYDSGMCATICDGSCSSEVILPEERHNGQNLHIRKDLMPGCISLDLLR